ncbi:hypothetical protein BpHYR1_049699, partial [Brachionus plicatilis]
YFFVFKISLRKNLTGHQTIRLEKNSYSPNSENSSLNSYSYSANSLLKKSARILDCRAEKKES